jgi:four helix bundle protein
MEYAYLALAQFPRSEKQAIVADVKRCMDRLLERAIEANKKYYKKNTLQEMDVELAKLKKYIRLTYRLKFLPFKKYRIWTEKTKEIGRMLGGWIKSIRR